MDKKLIIIPTYNEKENMEAIIRKVLSFNPPFEFYHRPDGSVTTNESEADPLSPRFYGGPPTFHVLVIDDGSPDGTAEIVKRLQREFGGLLHLLEREGKQGLGTAYLTGFKWALERDYDYIFEMDADFSHNPEDLLELLKACESGEADLAIGSRYCHGVSVVDWPIGRIVMSWYASKYVRMVLGMKIYDTTAGFKCYSRKVLETMDLDRVRMHGYGFQIEMKYTAWKLGFRLKEVPIIFINRQKGTSKMSGGIFGEAFWGVIGLKFRRIRKRQ